MTDINTQLEQMRALALQHYPDDEAARNGYLVEKLCERLREYAAKFAPLPVKEMTDDHMPALPQLVTEAVGPDGTPWVRPVWITSAQFVLSVDGVMREVPASNGASAGGKGELGC